jgi:hypothetical protein
MLRGRIDFYIKVPFIYEHTRRPVCKYTCNYGIMGVSIIQLHEDASIAQFGRTATDIFHSLLANVTKSGKYYFQLYRRIIFFAV